MTFPLGSNPRTLARGYTSYDYLLNASLSKVVENIGQVEHIIR